MTARATQISLSLSLSLPIRVSRVSVEQHVHPAQRDRAGASVEWNGMKHINVQCLSIYNDITSIRIYIHSYSIQTDPFPHTACTGGGGAMSEILEHQGRSGRMHPMSRKPCQLAISTIFILNIIKRMHQVECFAISVLSFRVIGCFHAQKTLLPNVTSLLRFLAFVFVFFVFLMLTRGVYVASMYHLTRR